MRRFAVLAIFIGLAWASEPRTYTEGKLLCAVTGPAGVYSRGVLLMTDGRPACSYAIEKDGIVYLSTATNRGSCSKDLMLGDSVQISIDEDRHVIYMKGEKGKDAKLGYGKRVRSAQWEGCQLMEQEVHYYHR